VTVTVVTKVAPAPEAAARQAMEATPAPVAREQVVRAQVEAEREQVVRGAKRAAAWREWQEWQAA
jgi:hypothetical protein